MVDQTPLGHGQENQGRAVPSLVMRWWTGAGWWRRTGAPEPRWPTYTEPVSRWLVLQQGDNPTTDYYVRPRAVQAGVPVSYRHLVHDRPSAEDLAPGTQVIVVRYLSPAWAQALRQHRRSLAGVVYLMDDDLLDPATWQDLPQPYQRKLQRHCQAHYADLAELVSEYWGSTPALCERYAARYRMRCTPPLPLVDDVWPAPEPVLPASGAPVQVFYHGSAAHHPEMLWLKPVMAQVLQRCPQVHFEIIGDHSVNRLYRDLPRTRVLHPMSWPNYLSHCRQMRGHVGLAPLLPGAFNAGRSPTKLFDMARCQARGVYANSPPYDAAVTQLGQGVCCDMEPDQWVAAIMAVTRSGNCPERD